MPSVNFAAPGLGAVATASSEAVGYGPAAAIDGNDLTYWRSAGSGYVEWHLDLGLARYIETARILAKSSGSTSSTYTLAYSIDGTTFVVVAVNIPRNVETVVATGGITARYWRLSATPAAANWNGLLAVEAIGPTAGPPPPGETLCADMQTWLDGLEAYWVPCVQNWLDAN